MKKNILITIAVIFLAVFFALYFSNKNVSKPDNIQYVKIAGKTIKVELAMTSKEQEQGLSGRVGLNENAGMLFVFDKPALYFFWMQDMNFAIDMIWLASSERAGISEDMHVIYIKKNADPSSYPETFGPQKNTKYVLEVVSGFADKNNLKAGDTVQFVK